MTRGSRSAPKRRRGSEILGTMIKKTWLSYSSVPFIHTKEPFKRNASSTNATLLLGSRSYRSSQSMPAKCHGNFFCNSSYSIEHSGPTVSSCNCHKNCSEQHYNSLLFAFIGCKYLYITQRNAWKNTTAKLEFQSIQYCKKARGLIR